MIAFQSLRGILLPPACKAIFFLLVSISFSLNADDRISRWVANGFEQKLFVENKGQFDREGSSGLGQVMYGADDLGTKMFFTRSGIVYRFDKPKSPEGSDLLPDRERFDNNEFDKQARKSSSETYKVQMQWLGSNTDVQMLAEEKAEEYFSYGDADVYQAFAYGKLIYRDLYPDIDVEYTFHPAGGIKYNIILHPGADPSLIKMRYSGEGICRATGEGNIRILTAAGDIIDHAPVTFYMDSKRPIRSAFSLSGDIVSFSLEGYDKAQTVVIDPWTTNPALATSNRVLEIGVDAAGNTYVYGSDYPFKLRKFSPGGTAMWTYNSPWNYNNWFGNFAVDSLGNCYITNGLGNASIEKINSAGVRVFSNNGTAGVMELFHLCFSKKEINAIGLIGAQPPATSGVAYVNTLTGAVSGVVPLAASLFGENRGLCASPNGNFYSLTSGGTIVGFTFTFVRVFLGAHGYGTITYESPAYKGYLPNIPGTQNAIAASTCFVYTYDGRTLKKWDASTGAALGNLNVPGGSAGLNSGIYADDCDFIYVGTGTGVAKYDAGLNFVSAAAAPGPVFDLDMNYATGEIVAAGNGFVTALNILSPGCAPTVCGTAVPLRFLDFDGRLVSGKAELRWTTTEESGISHFEIEASDDGAEFMKTGGVQTKNAGSSGGHYTYTDNRTLISTRYYRLKQIDLNGDHHYSGIKMIRNSHISGISLRPNPLMPGESLHLGFYLPHPETVSYSITSMQGTELVHATLAGQEGYNKFAISTEHMVPGLYTVRLVSPREVIVRKLMIR